MEKNKKTGYPIVTPREKEVMTGLAQGLSTQEIALKLGITFNTVESYRKVLLKKWKAKNTVQMMMLAGKHLPPAFWK